MRRENAELRLEHFASMDSIPGFIGHQTERSLADGFLFLFNPIYQQVNRTITFDGKLNKGRAPTSDYSMVKESYAADCGYMMEFVSDGQSVTIYQLIFIPINS
jgi:hypothetical protein